MVPLPSKSGRWGSGTAFVAIVLIGCALWLVKEYSAAPNRRYTTGEFIADVTNDRCLLYNHLGDKIQVTVSDSSDRTVDWFEVPGGMSSHTFRLGWFYRVRIESKGTQVGFIYAK